MTKTLTVLCNDPRQTNVLLSFKALVWKPIEVSPTLACFNLVGEMRSNLVQTVRITNLMTRPLELSSPECTSTNFRVNLKTIQAHQVYELEIKAIAPLPAPYVYGVTSLKTSTTNLPPITIPTVVSVIPEIQIIPLRIRLLENPVVADRTFTVLVRNHGAELGAVTSAIVNAEGIEPKIRELKPGRYYSVLLSIPKGFRLADGPRVELTLQTSHPKHARLTIPIAPLRP